MREGVNMTIRPFTFLVAIFLSLPTGGIHGGEIRGFKLTEGGVFVPYVETSLTYDDNVSLSSSGQESDYYGDLVVGSSLTRQTGNSRLDFRA